MSYQPQIPANLHLVADATVAPLHQHDCSCCHFLGRYRIDQVEADLYAHSGKHMPTVIARFSSDGPDYASGLYSAYGNSPDLSEARRRAVLLGVLDYDVYQALDYAKPDTPEFEELKRALPFTVEYQAVLAHERGDIERSDALFTHLVSSQHARLKRYEPKRRRANAYYDIEGRVIKILMTYRGCSWVEAYECLTPMLEHEMVAVLAEADVALDEDDEAANDETAAGLAA